MQTGLQDHYKFNNYKKLAMGYTTGSCAAAAAKAATIMLITQRPLSTITIQTPKGIDLLLEVKEVVIHENWASCAIQKDSGDDPDVTNNILIYAKVTQKPRLLKQQEKLACEHRLAIKGGKGIGVVTRGGLEQPVGEAAINKIPRLMIHQEVMGVIEEWDWQFDVEVEISAPKGEQIAENTFNERLGIKGGISILGTTGIVEPMSEQALVDCIRVEIRQQVTNGHHRMFFTPGNYGVDFCRQVYQLSMENAIKISNYIGEAIDAAVEYGATEILLIGHIGKLVKIAGGIMNTHSKNADCRLELLAICALKAGANTQLCRELLDANTTEEAVGLLIKMHMMKPVMCELITKIEYYLGERCRHKLKIGVVIFSSQYGELVQNDFAREMIPYYRKEEQ